MKEKNHTSSKADKPRVQFYSGYKSYEAPRSITIGKKELAIKRITEQKRITDFKSGRRYNLFVCETENRTFSIKVSESGESYQVSAYKEKEKHKDEQQKQ